jgi:hypothetical protein
MAHIGTPAMMTASDAVLVGLAFQTLPSSDRAASSKRFLCISVQKGTV